MILRLRTAVLLCCLVWLAPVAAQDSVTVSPTYYQAAGNDYFDEGAYGRAILAYERGLRLQPNHRALRNNLRYVRGEAAIDRPEIQEFWLIRAWRNLGAALGVALARWLAMGFWAGAVAVATVWLLRKERISETRRFALLPAAGTLLALSLTFYLLASSRLSFLEYDREAIIVAAEVDLRVAPGPDATLEERLQEGLKVEILDEFESFVKVSVENGRQGWLPLEAVERI